MFSRKMDEQDPVTPDAPASDKPVEDDTHAPKNPGDADAVDQHDPANSPVTDEPPVQAHPGEPGKDADQAPKADRKDERYVPIFCAILTGLMGTPGGVHPNMAVATAMEAADKALLALDADAEKAKDQDKKDGDSKGDSLPK